MENKKAYHVKGKFEASKYTYRNFAIRRGQEQNVENQYAPSNKRNESNTEKRQTGEIKIKETYDEILDLRKALITDDHQTRSVNQNYLKRAPGISSMHCQIMSVCAVKNSKKYSDTFNTKTDIIAERIVTKQQELQNKEKVKPKTRQVTARAPLYPVRLNEKCVAQRIFNTEKELKRKFEKVPKESDDKVKQLKSKLLEETRPGILKPSRESSRQSVKSNKSIDRYKPRFQLSTRSGGSRCKISTMSVQVNLEKPSNLSICTQTEAMRFNRNENVQTAVKDISTAKKIQTRIYKTSSIETSPIIIICPEKYTNTASAFPSSEHSTQMYEHYTMSDLFCLDWVNKHLFKVSLNPFNIIVDEKIKDVSEIASKSTFLSEKNPRFKNV